MIKSEEMQSENQSSEDESFAQSTEAEVKPKKKIRRGRKGKNKKEVAKIENEPSSPLKAQLDTVIEAIHKVAVSGCDMLDVVLGTETDVKLPDKGLDVAAGSSLDQYFAKEIETLSIAGQSADSVQKKNRHKRSIKKKETAVMDVEKSSDEQPAESTNSEKKKKPRSRKKHTNPGTGVQVEIINLESVSGEENPGKQDSAKKQPRKSSRKPKEGKENKDSSLSPKKSPHKSPVKGRPFRKSTNSDSTENEKFPDYWTEELTKSSLKEGSLIKGTLRINKKNFKEGYIKNPSGGLDIFLDGVKARNRSLEGDEIAVKLFPENTWKSQGERGVQKSGEVVFILEKMHHRKAVGSLKPLQHKNSSFALFVPRDYRIPRIRIPMSQCPPNFENIPTMVYLAEINLWQDTTYAYGNLLKVVGMPGTLEVETNSILLDNGLDVAPYDPSFNKYFPKAPYKIPEEEFKYREDLRKQCIFTIDPATARDLDDAVSFRKLDNDEGYEIGVHISDVAFFLTENTPLDEEVRQRATTTYLVQSVFHMLPLDLCRLCSLTPGEDKLSFSVFWKVASDLTLSEPRFTRSILHSCCQMSYEQAQAIIDSSDEHVWTEEELPKIFAPFTPQNVVDVVKGLRPIALKLRGHRFENGALRIDQPKLSFRIDQETGLPSEFNIYKNMECHRLIEELMLLANMAVAKQLFDSFPEIALLRCHSPPHDKLMSDLSKSLQSVGVDLDVSSSSSIHACLNKYISSENPEMKAIGYGLSSLLAKPMARARYFCSQDTHPADQWHYALSVPLYTHFTSPIRRYADVIVHRLLAASLEYTPHPGWHPDHVAQMASNCNGKKWSAKVAGEQSIELFLALYLGMNGSMKEEAVVISVMDYSLDVLMLSTGSNHRVYTNKMDPKEVKIEHNVKEKTVQVEWKQPIQVTQKIKTFSTVYVELSKGADLKIISKLCAPQTQA